MTSIAFQLNAIWLLRSFCLVSAVCIILARLIPALRKRFLNYGARAQKVSHAHIAREDNLEDVTSTLVDQLASLDVPHSWFLHFYVVSLLLSLLWLSQLVTQGRFIHFVADFVPQQWPAVPFQNSLLCIVLMFLQSLRRLWESYIFMKGSRSRMWVGHYAFGLAFYFCANVTVWIEGTHELLTVGSQVDIWRALFSSKRVLCGLALFIISSTAQHLAHLHLASLPKYSIPQHWLFWYVIAPHYTAECLIYLALAIIAAPRQSLFNGSVMCVTLLTTINLGITAQSTKLWMVQKFREKADEISGKYCMVPGMW